MIYSGIQHKWVKLKNIYGENVAIDTCIYHKQKIDYKLLISYVQHQGTLLNILYLKYHRGYKLQHAMEL